MHNKSQLTSDSKKKLTLNVLVHRGVFCQFPFRWIYYNGSNKSTGKEIGKNHLCVVYQYCIECQFFWIRLYYRLQIHLSDSYQTWWILDVYLITAWRLPDTHDNWGLTIMVWLKVFNKLEWLPHTFVWLWWKLLNYIYFNDICLVRVNVRNLYAFANI